MSLLDFQLGLQNLGKRSRPASVRNPIEGQSGGIPYLAMLGSQNAIGASPAVFNSVPASTQTNGNTEMELRPRAPSTPAVVKLPPKEESVKTDLIRDTKPETKPTELTNVSAENVVKPDQLPPFLIPQDTPNETAYGKYLRTRYEGATGRLEYDRLLENDLLFTALFHTAESVQKRILEEHKTNTDQHDFLDSLKRLFAELGKELVKETIKEGGKKIGIPDFIKDKVADKVKDAIPNIAPDTKEARLKALNDVLTALFADHKEWKTKLRHYSKYNGNTEFNKSNFEKEQEKEDVERATREQEGKAQETQAFQRAKDEVALFERSKNNTTKLRAVSLSWAKGKPAYKDKTPAQILTAYRAYIERLKSQYGL